MESDEHVYRKGELVPGPGTYRCLAHGEIWTVEESNVRFPPCDDSKAGETRWLRVEPETPR
jgi:hypothetical protein